MLARHGFYPSLCPRTRAVFAPIVRRSGGSCPALAEHARLFANRTAWPHCGVGRWQGCWRHGPCPGCFVATRRTLGGFGRDPLPPHAAASCGIGAAYRGGRSVASGA